MKRSLIAALLCVVSGSVQAQEMLGGDVSANVGFTSDYVFRGVSQSDEGPAVQGGVDYGHDSGFYIGAWGSNVDFNDGDEANVEIDVYTGISGEVNSLAWDVGAIYYWYPGADDSLDYDFWEAAGSLGYDFDIASVSGAINYSPDFFGVADDALYYAGYLDVPLPHDFSASAHVGYQDQDDAVDYTDWSVGIGYAFEGFELGLNYYDTDMDEPTECADGCSERVVFSITKSFP